MTVDKSHLQSFFYNVGEDKPENVPKMALQLFNKRIVCHRKKQTLAVLAAVVLVFCLMQLFSLLKLNIFRQQQGESGLYGSKHSNGRSTGIHYPDNDRELFTKSKETGNHRNVIQDDLPRGVHVDDAHLFKPNDRYMFTCIKTKVNTWTLNLDFLGTC